MLLRNAQVINSYCKSRFIAALIVSIGLVACQCRTTSVNVSGQEEWREGDLVLRCGNGMESRAVTQSSHSIYSHVGLLHYDSLREEWQVVHAVPGEDEPEYIKAEPIEVFFSSERAKNGAWLRVRCSDESARDAVRYALTKMDKNVLFDNDYLLADSTSLYCTELVWRAYRTQGIDVTNGRRHSLPTIFSKEGEAIFPNDIEQSETTLFVKHFN